MAVAALSAAPIALNTSGIPEKPTFTVPATAARAAIPPAATPSSPDRSTAACAADSRDGASATIPTGSANFCIAFSAPLIELSRSMTDRSMSTVAVARCPLIRRSRSRIRSAAEAAAVVSTSTSASARRPLIRSSRSEMPSIWAARRSNAAAARAVFARTSKLRSVTDGSAPPPSGGPPPGLLFLLALRLGERVALPGELVELADRHRVDLPRIKVEPPRDRYQVPPDPPLRVIPRPEDPVPFAL